MKRSPLTRRTPLRARRHHAEVRIGKVTGKIRLSGQALEDLRNECYRRDRGICRACGLRTLLHTYDGDPRKYDMAHIKSRGAGGSDTLDNVKTMHHLCHMREHMGVNQ